MRILSADNIMKLLMNGDCYEYAPHKFRDWDGNEILIKKGTKFKGSYD